MIGHNVTYAAGYTHKAPSYDEELSFLLRWIKEQQGDSLVLLGPLQDTVDNSALASALVRRGVPYLGVRRLQKQGLPRGDELRAVLLWPTSDLLGRVDDSGVGRLTAVGVLTWQMSDIDQWRRARQAVDVLGHHPIEPAPTIHDPAVLGAMRSLTDAVNLSTGLTHPMDWDRAVLTFRRLRASRISWDPAEIATWAMTNGWSSRHVRDLQEIAAVIAAGRTKRLKARTPSFSASVLDHWRARAQE